MYSFKPRYFNRLVGLKIGTKKAHFESNSNKSQNDTLSELSIPCYLNNTCASKQTMPTFSRAQTSSYDTGVLAFNENKHQ